MKWILFRVDASTSIGTGHLMRCLTLAERLLAKGCHVWFASRELADPFRQALLEKGVTVVPTPNDISFEAECEAYKQLLQACPASTSRFDWIVVDHYGLDQSWEQTMRTITRRIAVIDDLANRVHDCDVLLDQNLVPGMDLRYRELVPSTCRQLLGPGYAILRPEFTDARLKSNLPLLERQGLLVFFGGSDPTGETLKALDALTRIDRAGLDVHVVTGYANPNHALIRSRCEQAARAGERVHFHLQIDYMAELMRQSRLALGAGGTTTWERCYLGVPSLVVMVADNQVELTEAVATTGALMNLGWHEQVSVDHMAIHLEACLHDMWRLNDMHEQALRLMKDAGFGDHALVRIICEED